MTSWNHEDLISKLAPYNDLMLHIKQVKRSLPGACMQSLVRTFTPREETGRRVPTQPVSHMHIGISQSSGHIVFVCTSSGADPGFGVQSSSQ
jgi:hypothetical protein